MGPHSVVTNEGITSRLTMKVMGLFAITYAVCLLGMVVSQPLFFPEPVSSATFTTAAGLTLLGATGTELAVIPTGALVLGGLAAKTGALIEILALQQQQQQSNRHH